MQPLRLCVFLTFIAVFRCYELSPTMAEFYCIVNGEYSNKAQVSSGESNHTLATVKKMPIFAPAISQIPVLYLEQVDNGVVVRSMVEVITEGADGIVYSQPYNISGNNTIAPDTFDPQVLKTITRDQLEAGGAGCTVTYKRIAPFIFLMRYPDCKHTAAHGQRESYDGTFSCNTFTAIVPPGAAENSPMTPYVLDLLGEKYTQENAPSNYVCNCSTTGS